MMLDFGEAVRRFYKNYNNPEGRSQRSAYWWYLLYETILTGVFLTIFFMADGSRELFEFIVAQDNNGLIASWEALAGSGRFAIYGFVIFGLVNFLPKIMLEIRRFHDLGQTGWFTAGFLILSFLPVFGVLISIGKLIWFAMPGTQGPNQYGPDPLQ